MYKKIVEGKNIIKVSRISSKRNGKFIYNHEFKQSLIHNYLAVF